MRDVAQMCKGKKTLETKSYAAPTNGTGVDIKGYNSCVIFVQSGVVGATTNTFEVKDSDNDSAYTAVDDKYLTGTEASLSIGDTDEHVVRRIGYKGPKRYVRLDLMACGAASLLSGTVILADAQNVPVTQD